MPVSVYIPCFNNEATLGAVIASIRAQTVPVDELLVIDDGSTDGSAKLAEALGARVIRHGSNLGRGAARARGMLEARHDLVLCCDGTKPISEDLLQRALPWFEDPIVAAVCGRMGSIRKDSTVQRWRARHLYKSEAIPVFSRSASLMTCGALVRKSLCEQVGGYDPALRHSEDADLGQRLLCAGYQVICDPGIVIFSDEADRLGKVLERYWRWHAGKDEALSVKAYLKQIVYSIKVMARQDLAACDLLAVPISLLSPHYQFWRSAWRRARGLNQTSKKLC